jgi:hypothetical protein
MRQVQQEVSLREGTEVDAALGPAEGVHGR